MEINNDDLFHLALAVNDLDIKPLFELCCAKIARMTKDKTMQNKNLEAITCFLTGEGRGIVLKNIMMCMCENTANLLTGLIVRIKEHERLTAVSTAERQRASELLAQIEAERRRFAELQAQIGVEQHTSSQFKEGLTDEATSETLCKCEVQKLLNEKAAKVSDKTNRQSHLEVSNYYQEAKLMDSCNALDAGKNSVDKLRNELAVLRKEMERMQALCSEVRNEVEEKINALRNEMAALRYEMEYLREQLKEKSKRRES